MTIYFESLPQPTEVNLQRANLDEVHDLYKYRAETLIGAVVSSKSSVRLISRAPGEE